jgi:hypothetical protein
MGTFFATVSFSSDEILPRRLFSLAPQSKSAVADFDPSLCADVG